MKIQNQAFSIALWFVLFCCVGIAQDSQTVNFVNDIKPILESNCVSCHGADEPEGGYRIDIRDEALEYIESGDADASELYEYLVTDDEDTLMPPPDDGGPLDDSDIKLIKTWINEGASWPDGLTLQDVTAETDDDDVDIDVAPAAPIAKGPNVYRAIGTLHPAAIHLPIGLLLAAGLFALLSLRGNFVMSDCAYYCLWLGTLGAIAACLTGWWFTLSEYPKEAIGSIEDLANQDHKLFWHRSSALAATVFALLLSLFASSARNRDPDDGMGWKLCAILLAIGIGFVGHQGGELTWKASHYNELKEVLDQFAPGLFGEADGVDEVGDDADADAVDTDLSDEVPDADDGEEAGGSGEASGELDL